MATLLEYMKFSLNVYAASTENLMGVPLGWNRTNWQPDMLSGFSAGTFVKGNEVVISYTGTNNFPADQANWLIGAGLPFPQIFDAIDYYFKIKAAYPTANITFTGHSLGAGLASLMSVYFDKQATVFDEAPFQLAALNPLVTDAVAVWMLSKGYSDIAFSDYILLASAPALNREANVTHYYMEGEVLEKARLLAPNLVGQEHFYAKGDSEGEAVALHSMGLLTAIESSGSFHNAVKKLPSLVSMMADESLFSRGNLAPEKDFIRNLLRHQFGVQGSVAVDNMLERFASDMAKLAQDGGLTMNDANIFYATQNNVSKALIAFAMQMYYEDTPNAKDATKQLFSAVTGGVQVDMADVSQKILAAFTQSTPVELSDAKGYKEYFSQYLNGALTTFTDEERVLINDVLPKMRDWYIQAGTSGMDTADTHNRHAFMLGGATNDTLTGGNKSDLLVGNTGNDTLYGKEGDDALLGGAGGDALYGNEGKDTLLGGLGDDVLTGGEDNDQLKGGAGNDEYLFTSSFGTDVVSDSDGNGTIIINSQTLNSATLKFENIYKNDASGYTVTKLNGGTSLALTKEGDTNRIIINDWSGSKNLSISLTGDLSTAPTATRTGDFTKKMNDNGTPGDTSDDYLEFENLTEYINLLHELQPVGNYVADGALANAQDNLQGNDNQDVMFGLGGDDYLSGVKGDDYLDGGNGADILFGGLGKDTLMGGAGDDFIDGSISMFANWTDYERWKQGGYSLIVGAASDTLLGSGWGWVYYKGATTEGMLSQIGFNRTVYRNFVTFWNASSDLTTFNYNTPEILNTDVGNLIDGGAGDDYIIAGMGNDSVHGGDNNDQIAGDGGEDIIFGDSGNDILSGDAYLQSQNWATLGWVYSFEEQQRDIIDGGSGNDYIFGQGKGDILFGGTGNDFIWGDDINTTMLPGIYHGDDYIDGGDDNDQLVGGGKDDTLLGGGGDDNIWGDDTETRLSKEFHGNDYLDGGKGNDYLEGGAGNDTLDGGEDDDQLQGGIGNDTLISNSGNDVLAGGKGDDTYLINSTGVVHVSDSEGNNIIRFGTNNNPANLKLRVGSLLLDFGNGNQVHIDNFDQNNVFNSASISSFEFTDGTTLTTNQLLVRGFDLEGTNNKDIITGTNTVDRIQGLAGNDSMDGLAGDDVLEGGMGNDSLQGGDGDDLLNGATGDDIMAGGAGNDTYQFNLGDGQDVVSDTQGLNTIKFGANITQQDLHVSQYQGDDGSYYLKVQYGLLGDSIVIQDGLTGSIQNYQFSDGSSISHSDLIGNSGIAFDLHGSSKADSLYGTANDNMFYAGKGDDQLYGLAGDDTLYGEAGNDTLNGGNGDDWLDGGTGNDTLLGEAGQDFYSMYWGMGKDVALDGFGIEINTVQLDSGITLSDLDSRRVGNDLFINFKATDEGIVLKDYYGGNQQWQISGQNDQIISISDFLAISDHSTGIEKQFNDYQIATKALYYSSLGADGFRLSSDDVFYKTSTEVINEPHYSSVTVRNEASKFQTYTQVSDEAYITRSTSKEIWDSQEIYYHVNYTPEFSGLGSGTALSGTATGGGVSSVFIPNGVNDGSGNSNSGGLPSNSIQTPNGVWLLFGSSPYTNGSGSSTIITNVAVNASYQSHRTLTLEKIVGGDSDNVIIYSGNAFGGISGLRNLSMVDGGAGNDTIFSEYEGGLDRYFSDEDEDFYFPGLKVNNYGALLYGNVGNDSIDGTRENDTIIGGDNSDVMNGHLGADTYLINAEDTGTDIINDSAFLTIANYFNINGTGYANWYYLSLGINDWQQQSEAENVTGIKTLPDLPVISALNYTNLAPLYTAGVIEKDTVEFGTGINLADLTLSWGKGTLDISWSADKSMKIIMPIVDLYGDNNIHASNDIGDQERWHLGAGIEQFKFSDGTIVSMAEMIANLPPIPNSAPIRFNVGDGSVVKSVEWINTIVLGANITVDNITIRHEGYDLVITLANGVDQLRIKDWYADQHNYPQIKAFFEDDNLTLDSAYLTFSALNDGTAGDDVLIGLSDIENTIYGLAGNDQLTGGNSHDELDGGEGADTMVGGNGSDRYTVDNAADSIIEAQDQGYDTVRSTVSYTLTANVEDLVLLGTDSIAATGNDLDNYLEGNASNNTINGGAGNDYLDGGEGADTMIGGDGDDIYTVDNAADTVIEAQDQGYDSVNSTVSYTLTANVEDLVLLGTDSINATGNELNNYLSGNDGNNTLYGEAGNDYLDNSLGEDTLIGGAGDDIYTFYLGSGHDQIDNTASDNSVANDTLQFWDITPTDIVLTRVLNDLLLTVNETDSVTLKNYYVSPDNRIDQIQFSVYDSNTDSYINTTWDSATIATKAPSADPDQHLTGTAGNDVLVGGSGNDTLDGGLGKDTLSGGLGNDTYIVDNTLDIVSENLNAGTDTVQSSVTYTLTSNVENITLTGSTAINATGNALDNILTGNLANNILDGKAGADQMAGSLGNDTYIIDNIGDAVIENTAEGTDTVKSSISYILGDNVENLILTGTEAINGIGNDLNNSITGNTASNILTGGTGNDILNGGIGADILVGNLGNDTYIIDDINDVVIESLAEGTDTVKSSISYTLGDNLENLTLTGIAAINGTGNDLNNSITGNIASNILTGGTGNDILNGAAGADTLIGNLGNDTYVIDNIGDVVIENAAEGTDTVQTAITFNAPLAANVENLTLTGTATINGSGNELDNVITGNAADNVLYGNDGNDKLIGAAGADTLVGGLGDDVYTLDNVSDVILENAGEGTDTVQTAITLDSLAANVENLTLTGTAAINGTGNVLDNILTGNAAANTLSGDLGNDTLDGKAGADTLIGGLGNDTYIVDNLGDLVTENDNEGIDTIQTGIILSSLAANVENLTLTGIAAINAMGNALNNTLTGNTGNNILNGGLGSDTLIGGAGNDSYIVDDAGDIVIENLASGTDNVQSSISYALTANVENLILTGTDAINALGNILNNTITGNTAANILDGGIGNDTMKGGAGDDTYLVDSTTDVVTELAAEGTDTVQTSVTYTLAANLENLTLTGADTINGTGNTLNNTLIGNLADNILSGGTGADTLIGGLGNDTYVVDNAGDLVTENDNEGTDTVKSNVSVVLSNYLENLTLTGAAAINGTGNALSNFLMGNTGSNILMDTAGGNDLLQGLAGNDTLTDTTGNNLYDGGLGTDTLNAGSGNDLLIGGLGNDTITTGTGYDVIVFNKGDGKDTINASTGADNTLSLGGNFAYSDLSLTKTGNNLILKMGTTDQITLSNWYGLGSDNKSVVNLQVIAKAIQGFSLGSTDALRNNKVETFNFTDLVTAFDAAGATANWQLTDARLTTHLQAGSDTAAIGGDMAYQYGNNSNLTGMGLMNAQSVIAAASFGQTAQTLNNPTVWQVEVAKLA